MCHRHSTASTAGPTFSTECECLTEVMRREQRKLTWLLSNRVNVVEGEPNDRQMTTGHHTVRDIFCVKCGTTLGWKYVSIHPITLSRLAP